MVADGNYYEDRVVHSTAVFDDLKNKLMGATKQFQDVLTTRTKSSIAGVIDLKWAVEYMHWSPDCIESVVMGINGNFPGPTITATASDLINIELTNHLHTEGVVIHWHGITQKGTPWADGTASISQCAINAGETFVYSFTVEKAGTFFYHGH